LHFARIAELDALRAQKTRDQVWASSMEESIATSFADEEIEGSAEDLYAVAELQRLGRRIANVRMRAYQTSRASEPVALGRGNFLR
jgi:hypothetical protein